MLAIIAQLLATPPDAAPVGDSMLEAIVEASEFELRQRRIAGGVGLFSGSVQLTSGTLLMVAADGTGDPMFRAGRIHAISGGASIALGISTLALPSPLARLRRSSAFLTLEHDPQSPRAVQTFDREWKRMARRVRRTRIVIGSISIAAGVALSTFATVQMALGREDSADAIVDVSMLATGAGILGTGVSGVILSSEVERAYQRRKKKRHRARVGFGFAAVSVSGQF